MGRQENELIKAAKNGRQDALEAIFRLHAEGAVRLAYLITRDWAVAEDAVQEAFLRAFRSLASFKDGRPFKPWFTAIVVNEAKRVKSSFQRELVLSENNEENPHRVFKPEERTLEKEDLAALFTAINSLDDNQRLPLILKYFSGLTEKETAEVLQIPASTVKSRLYVARQRLKKIIEERKGGGPVEF